MANTIEFTRDLEKGKAGERLFAQHISNSAYLEDVSDDVEWQRVDVDFIVVPYASEDDLYTVDVKNSLRNGKVILEMSSNKKRGWWNYSTAERFAFVNTDNSEVHIIKRKDIEKYLKYCNTLLYYCSSSELLNFSSNTCNTIEEEYTRYNPQYKYDKGGWKLCFISLSELLSFIEEEETRRMELEEKFNKVC